MILVSLELNLESFKELRTGLVLGGASGRTGSRGIGEEGLDVAGRFESQGELVALSGEVAELALELVASLDVRYVTTLEGGQVGVELLLWLVLAGRKEEVSRECENSRRVR